MRTCLLWRIERAETRMPLYVSGTRPTALPPHDGDAREAPEEWWRTPYGEWRLSVEAEAMRRFPGFALTTPGLGRLSWRGELTSTFDLGRQYAVRVTYPDRFPDEAPEVLFEAPAFPEGTPHLLEGRRPCLFRPAQGPRQGYDPARTTAATLVTWTALWIHAFETWLVTDAWPGGEA
jgi:hypothetical protein